MPAVRWRWPLYTLLLGIAVLAVLPLWVVRVLPASGWTQNMHVARVLADVIARGPDAYHGRLWVPTPNSLVPYTLALLGSHLGYVLATRLLATLALLGLPWAWLAWLRASGRSPWLAIAALPWLLGPAYLQGDLPLLLAWPLCFAALALHLRAMEQGGWRRWLLLALPLTLLAVTHPVVWLAILALLPLLAILQAGRTGWRPALRHLLLTLLAVLPSIALLLPWMGKVLASLGGLRGFQRAWRSEWWLPGDNLRQLADLSLDGFGNHGPRIESLLELRERSGELLAFAWLVALVMWLAASMREARERTETSPAPLNPHPVHALAIVTLGYFLLPARLIAPLPLGQFSALLPPVIAMLAALALPFDPLVPPRSVRLRTWAASAVLLTVAVALPVYALRSMLLDSAAFGGLEQAMAAIPQNQRVCTISARSDTRHVRAGVHDDLGAWPLILRGGLVNEAVPDVLWTPVIEHTHGHLPYLPRAQEMRLEDGKACQYFAVFRDPGVQIEQITRQFRPLPRVYGRDMWEIYQNLKVGPWPPPLWLTPQTERMLACALGQMGLQPVEMPAEQAETMQVRVRLGWNIRCIDPVLPPTTAPIQPPRMAVPQHMPLLQGVPDAPGVLH
jgi:hypothetical protein